MSLNILITGAGRGLGLYLTKALLQKKHSVIALYNHKSDALEKLRTGNPTLITIQADVSDESSVKEAADKLSKTSGFLDILVNNAAVHLETPPPDIFHVDFEAVEKTLSINSIGPLRVTKHFLPMLLKGNKKLLVNISSEAGSIEDAWRLREYGYCMSKAALNMQSRLLQNRLKDQRIKVLAVHPGWVRTDMGGDNADLTPEESANSIIEILESDWPLDGPVYIDWQKRPMKW